tara:strand:+ start:1166 stop:1543 length:378 start_codon:yes stop_codon:yes gene_type:complete
MPAFMTITGRIARDPETRTTNKGTTVCKLTIPVDTGWGDNKRTTWWTVSLFGKRAETAGKYLSKGQWTCVSGKPEVRTYEKKDGTHGFSAEMVADTFDFVGPKEQDSVGNGGRAQSGPSFDDLPF